MVAAEKSLHWVVDKWLAPTPSMPARVVRFCHRASQQQRYVCVQALNARTAVDFLLPPRRRLVERVPAASRTARDERALPHGRVATQARPGVAASFAIH